MVQEIEALNFPVSVEPILHSGEESGHQKIIREDTKELISITSDKYLLIKNKLVTDRVQNYLNDLGLDFKPRKVFSNNSYSKFELIIDQERSISTKLGSDLLKPLITVENSYDTTKSLRVSLSAYRLVCSNGMMMMESLFSSSTKHLGQSKPEDVVESMIEHLDNSNRYFLKICSHFERMSKLKITKTRMDAFIEMLSNKAIPNYVKTQILLQIKEQSPQNMWGLYNCVTYVASHVLDHKKSSSNMIENKLNKEVLLLTQ